MARRLRGSGREGGTTSPAARAARRRSRSRSRRKRAARGREAAPSTTPSSRPWSCCASSLPTAPSGAATPRTASSPSSPRSPASSARRPPEVARRRRGGWRARPGIRSRRAKSRRCQRRTAPMPLRWRRRRRRARRLRRDPRRWSGSSPSSRGSWSASASLAGCWRRRSPWGPWSAARPSRHAVPPRLARSSSAVSSWPWCAAALTPCPP
mmetsp:Transcript_88813/g.256130  ORF Transcript_88813/g.256130 Transcript_88813/m.256130 type:complete len:210 (+) Transcript_88813:963-1592(+)